jgi:hypothetical protein
VTTDPTPYQELAFDKKEYSAKEGIPYSALMVLFIFG